MLSGQGRWCSTPIRVCRYSKQALLAGCRSVRATRAFLVLAHHAGHAWYGRLAPDRLDLGKGKRQLCQGGKLDREYHVTVPEAFLHAD